MEKSLYIQSIQPALGAYDRPAAKLLEALGSRWAADGVRLRVGRLRQPSAGMRKEDLDVGIGLAWALFAPLPRHEHEVPRCGTQDSQTNHNTHPKSDNHNTVDEREDKKKK